MPDHLRKATLGHLDHIAFAFAIARCANDAHRDLVTVPRTIHIALIDKHIFAIGIVDKTVAILVRLQDTAHQILFAIGCEQTFGRHFNIACGYQLIDNHLQTRHFGRRHIQFLGEREHIDGLFIHIGVRENHIENG